MSLAELCRDRPGERPMGGFRALVGGVEVQVLAVLERTVVVAPAGVDDPELRRLLLLEEVVPLDPGGLRWRSKGGEFRPARTSAQRGDRTQGAEPGISNPNI